MISLDQQRMVKETVQKYVDIANEKLTNNDSDILKPLNISYKLKGTISGHANYSLKTVTFNEVLISENFDFYINDTIPHEVAHIVVNHFHSTQTRGHGRHWKFVMKSLFGINPSRCHNLDVSNSVGRNTKKFIYKCHCDTDFYISTNRHHKIQSGLNRICAKCRKRIVFTGKQTDKLTLMSQDKI